MSVGHTCPTKLSTAGRKSVKYLNLKLLILLFAGEG